jgi:hypothetical protein
MLHSIQAHYAVGYSKVRRRIEVRKYAIGDIDAVGTGRG